MNDTQIATTTVVAVLLADGWHRIVPGSFSVGTLSFGAEAGPGTPGFRFEEADAGRPYQPTVLAGPQPVDRWGGTPLSDAEAGGHTQVAGLLRQAVEPDEERNVAV